MRHSALSRSLYITTQRKEAEFICVGTTSLYHRALPHVISKCSDFTRPRLSGKRFTFLHCFWFISPPLHPQLNARPCRHIRTLLPLRPPPFSPPLALRDRKH